MAYKCILRPQQASYSVTDGAEVVRTQLAGGMGRYRRDIIGATSTVNVLWNANEREYEYLRAFYKTVVNEGSRKFLIDLLLDGPGLTEHEAMFLPAYGMRLDGVDALTSFVSAQLEVLPIPRNADNDSMFIAAVEAFGLDDWERYADMLDQALVEMPI